ncbi:hypothetical protein PAXRUDRAFT_833983 [Paxillus rubicundulus Ve08.2h10]|uniref:Uncharacterized protein n=1 Tax=Paxillus rubicundulus Ve08.2h10 TaxID=930991 RepID=A0A0D0D7J6_9AGAM|nr:hypothetical protein PAXRUDRAFT_833983 [Paxillus rubicundulus Ve08.2h10]
MVVAISISTQWEGAGFPFKSSPASKHSVKTAHEAVSGHDGNKIQAEPSCVSA